LDTYNDNCSAENEELVLRQVLHLSLDDQLLLVNSSRELNDRNVTKIESLNAGSEFEDVTELCVVPTFSPVNAFNAALLAFTNTYFEKNELAIVRDHWPDTVGSLVLT
jgi:hypothetical protein